MSDAQISQYMEALYPEGIPQGLRTYVWTLHNRRSYWADSVEGLVNHATANGHKDTYLGLALTDKRGGPRSRINADEATAIPGYWYEIDCKNAVAHKKENLPTRPEAWDFIMRELTQAVGSPTLIVWSGYGFHLYWLFPTLYEVGANTADGLLEFSSYITSLMLDKGWQADSTHDLSRVYRIPGTMNCKGDEVVQATIEHYDPNGRMTPDALRSRVWPDGAPDASPHPDTGSRASSEATLVEDDIPVLPWLVMAELMGDPEFKRTWERKRGPGRPSALKDDSDSGYAFALINKCINSGLRDEIIVAILREWMRIHNIPERTESGNKRDLNWMLYSISKARRTSNVESDITERIEAADEAANGGDRDQVFGALSRYAGVPIKKVKRYGNDEEGNILDDKAYYVMVLDINGKDMELNIGTVDKLMSANVIRARIVDATYGQSLPPLLKADKWEPMARNAIRFAERVDIGTDSEEIEWVTSMVESYLGAVLMADDKKEAHENGAPYRENNLIYIFMAPLMQHISSYMKVNTTPHALGRSLTRMEAKRHKVRIGEKTVWAWALPPHVFR